MEYVPFLSYGTVKNDFIVGHFRKGRTRYGVLYASIKKKD
jgi:hypothetical protein